MSDELKILKTASCPSLSERSTLTYEIVSKDSAVHLRLTGNTGKGIFSKEWIPLSLITALQAEDETPITAKKLRDVFRGRSVNTVGFAIGILLAEGLLKISESSLRCYERVPAAEYQKILQSYVNSESPPSDAEKTSKAKKSKNEEQP